ncbi:hypothetical protein LTR85_001836 [Meristemomyces frigidus]|nr:hypothetical protein LTR85_001836 [Meristemomyces frigidus]
MENSPFARLAPELRNRIFELALKSDDPIVIFERYFYNGTVRLFGAEGQSRPTSLFRTCKTIHNEAAQLFYAINTFEVDMKLQGCNYADSYTRMESVESSRFGKLAPELRNHIYELALTHDKPYGIRAGPSYGGLRLVPQNGLMNLPALTATCRAIRRESTALFYAHNTFELEITERDPARYASAIDDILTMNSATNKAVLSSVTLDIGRLEENKYCLLATAVKQVLDRFTRHNPDLPYKVMATCRFTDGAQQTPGELVIEIDMRDQNLSCNRAADDMTLRLREETLGSARVQLRALEQVLRAAQFC